MLLLQTKTDFYRINILTSTVHGFKCNITAWRLEIKKSLVCLRVCPWIFWRVPIVGLEGLVLQRLQRITRYTFSSRITVIIYSPPPHYCDNPYLYGTNVIINIHIIIILSKRTNVKFQDFMSVTIKIVSFYVMPCSLVEICGRFRGSCCVHHQGR